MTAQYRHWWPHYRHYRSSCVRFQLQLVRNGTAAVGLQAHYWARIVPRWANCTRIDLIAPSLRYDRARQHYDGPRTLQPTVKKQLGRGPRLIQLAADEDSLCKERGILSPRHGEVASCMSCSPADCHMSTGSALLNYRLIRETCLPDTAQTVRFLAPANCH